LSGANRFDRTADLYAAHAANRDWTAFVAWCEPKAGDRVLDVAGGPGALAAALVDRVGSVTVLDAAPALLDHAPEGVETVVGRAEQLPFADASFDLVTCVNSLHHIARPARALDEMARVLGPGGRLVLEDMVADPDPRRARRWEEIERLRDPEHGRHDGLGPSAQGLHSSEQLFQGERLGHVVVGAHPERLDLEVHRVLRGEHQHRDPLAPVTQRAQHLEPRERGQPQIQHQHVVVPARREAQPLGTIADQVRGEPGLGQAALDVLPDRLVVLDDENLQPMGRYTLKFEPTPTCDSTSIRPRCSAMMP